ncbi:MAG: single-stranded DNA-binding protein [Acidimicrobiia bacterium]|nr:single-stranded DNA-binding protein [Acidimicrobiia bacterium]MDH3470083.1 single-stranded DNA-binding protein [Acidimicrobiia bacterium]
MSTNSVTLIGNLVDDPELRFTPAGIAMAKVRFAVNRRYQKNGEWTEDTSFFGGTLWRDAAENAAESLQKGMRVIVTGRLEQRSWETQEGEKRSMVEVAIDEIGPSLRWATATITKTAKTESNWGGGDDAPAPSPQVPAAAPAGVGGDDAPF